MLASTQDTYVQHVDGALIERNEVAGDLDAIKRALHANRLRSVTLNPRVVMLLDADADARGLPLNPEATAILKRVMPSAPPVRGNVVIDWLENHAVGTLPP